MIQLSEESISRLISDAGAKSSPGLVLVLVCLCDEMEWRKILGQFNSESPLTEKRGQCLKAFTVQEWSHLVTGRYSNSETQIAVIQPCALRYHLAILSECLMLGYSLDISVVGFVAGSVFFFPHILTYNLIWRRCARYVAFHLSSLPSHCILDWIAGDDGRTCSGQKKVKTYACAQKSEIHLKTSDSPVFFTRQVQEDSEILEI